jgi:hypothetical protein
MSIEWLFVVADKGFYFAHARIPYLWGLKAKRGERAGLCLWQAGGAGRPPSQRTNLVLVTIPFHVITA